jgi:monoamine oxidase
MNQSTIPTYPHISIQDQLTAIQKHNTGHKKITILGAGIAGLAAAYELAQHGHEVDEILEASDRVGGRIYTHRFDNGAYGELGAMRVAAAHDYTHHYIRLLGLKTIPFLNSTDNNFLDIRGAIARNKNGPAKILSQFQLPPFFQENAKSGGQIFGMLLDQALDSLTEAEQSDLFMGKTSTDLLRYYDSLSLGEFLSRRASLETQQAIAAYTCLEPFWDLSFTVFLREEIVNTGDYLTTLDGGMSRLSEELRDRVLQCQIPIQYRTEVTGISLLPDQRVALRMNQGGFITEKVCDYVLCTLPFSVLRQITLKGFTQAKYDAINNIHYVSPFKMLLNCQQRFWEQPHYGILAGASVSDQLQRQVYYPQDSAQVAGPAPNHRQGRGSFFSKVALPVPVEPTENQNWEQPGALLVYNWGQDAVRLASLPFSVREAVVLERIERFHPEIRDFYIDSQAMDWASNRWSAGGFSLFRPQQIPQYYEGAIAPNGRVYFAGEHCSTDNGWIQGALIAALRAVLEIVSD